MHLKPKIENSFVNRVTYAKFGLFWSHCFHPSLFIRGSPGTSLPGGGGGVTIIEALVKVGQNGTDICLNCGENLGSHAYFGLKNYKYDYMSPEKFFYPYFGRNFFKYACISLEKFF